MPASKQFTHFINSRGNLGEVRLRAQQVLVNPYPLLRTYYFGKWLLFVGPRSIKTLMTNVVAGLAEHEDIRVLDCGNHYDPKLAAGLARDKPDLSGHIHIKHAHSAAEALYILDHTSMIPQPFIALDLLRPFQDGAIDFEKRKGMLAACLQNLRRLQLSTGGMVSLSPPSVGADADARELYALVRREAKRTFDAVVFHPAAGMERDFFQQAG